MGTNSISLKNIVPIRGLVVAALAVVVMVTASTVAWPTMAESIVTREAGGNHGASVIPRPVGAVGLPIALILVAAMLAVTPAIDQKMLGRLSINRQRNTRNSVRVISYALAGIAILLTILHLGLIAAFSGQTFPIEHAMTAAIGFVLILIGVSLPLARPRGTFESTAASNFRDNLARTYRGGAVALIGLGALCVILSFVAPPAAMVITCLGILIIFSAMAAVALTRKQRASEDSTVE
jgi:hypothetical protein